MNMDRVPIHQKMNLTIKEAAEYSNIGEHKIREMVARFNCPFKLYVGKKVLIKRKEFENYISAQTEV